MQPVHAHLYIKHINDKGETIDTIYILDHVTITPQERLSAVKYILGEHQQHPLPQGPGKYTFTGDGRFFRQGLEDPRTTQEACQRRVKVAEKTVSDLDFEQFDSIELE